MNQNQSSIHILNIVVAHDLFTNYLNANPKGPFGKSEYDARIREYNKKNMLDKEIHLISCKQYLINNMQVMDLLFKNFGCTSDLFIGNFSVLISNLKSIFEYVMILMRYLENKIRIFWKFP